MRAGPDGHVPATDDRPAATPAVIIDASHDLEICHCAAHLRLLVAVGFAMTLLSASLAFNWWDGIVDHDTAVGYASVVVFSLVTCWLIWMLPAERGPVVVVTPYGIRDLRLGNEFLLWDSIAEISAEECRGHKVIVLTPTPALQRLLPCIMSRGTQPHRIIVRAEGLTMDVDTLLRACRDCHAADDSRTALRRDRDHGAQGLAAQAS
ncbi:STM3941 family protein [Bradyrhizobium sp.]|uniref:STM3941 family protein n=1 Tax=Bradyrhizobium sp. TaxID=376 RepID=UPI0039E59413